MSLTVKTSCRRWKLHDWMKRNATNGRTAPSGGGYCSTYGTEQVFLQHGKNKITFYKEDKRYYKKIPKNVRINDVSCLCQRERTPAPRRDEGTNIQHQTCRKSCTENITTKFSKLCNLIYESTSKDCPEWVPTSLNSISVKNDQENVKY